MVTKAKGKGAAKPAAKQPAVALLRASFSIKGTLVEGKVLSDGGTEVCGVLQELGAAERARAAQVWEALVKTVGTFDFGGKL